MNTSIQSAWQQYVTEELPTIKTLLSEHGYQLQEKQPHIKGERFLMQAMTTASGKKLILLGSKNDTPVVIKATRDRAGIAELQHERLCRKTLHAIDFAYDSFHSPAELDFIEQSGYAIGVYAFIEQSSTFLERPIEQQFKFALHALKIQEGARATTRKHFRKVAHIFGNRTAKDYLRLFVGFKTFIQNEGAPEAVLANVAEAESRLREQKTRLEQYCGFLTHTDFVPHNFRIKDDTLYLLDFSSLQFGNKHESWARFLNFMTLYNPELENLLIQYVEDNRSPEERESLQLMRLFRLGEIIAYYVDKAKKSDEDLRELNVARVELWNNVLAAELQNQRVSREIVASYQQTRDRLRSQEEKERQVGLH